MEGDGLCGKVWPSPQGSCATPSPLGEGWGEGLVERFMESPLFETDLLTAPEPWSEDKREHRVFPIPKGLRPKARGCEGRATPG